MLRKTHRIQLVNFIFFPLWKKKSQVKKYYRAKHHIKYLSPGEADGGGRKWVRKGGQHLFTPWIKLSLYWWEGATAGKSNSEERGRE